MATPSSIARPFVALSGAELKKILLTEIERLLDADYRFKNHLTYPLVSWRWQLAMKVYPSDNPDIKVDVAKDTGRPMASESLHHDFVLDSERTVAAPAAGETADAVRRDVGIEVPAPRTVRGPGGDKLTVDAPEIPLAGQNEPAKVVDVHQSPTAKVLNRARPNAGSPGRSVAIRTNANPTGVQVPEPAGSAPDAERQAEIASKEAAEPPESTEP